MHLMPKKHVKYSDSIIGFAPIVYKEWIDEKSINDNLEIIQKKYRKDIADVILCIDFLYCLNKMDFSNEKGLFKK